MSWESSRNATNIEELMYILAPNLVRHDTAIRNLRLEIRVEWGGVLNLKLRIAVS